MNNSTAVGCNLCGLYSLCLFGRVSGLRIRRIRLERGRPLFRHGESVEGLFVIRSGCVKEVEVSSGRHGLIVNFAMAGEILSLQSLQGAPSRTTAITIEPSFVCIVPWSASNRSCVIAPYFAGKFMQLIAEAGLKARESLTLIRDKEAHQRVAGFLLDVMARTQVYSVRAREFRLGMNRDDIANYLDIRSETVSRCISELARRGVIEVKAKRVQVLQVTELRRIYAGS
jgi:CRP/FNR family transcriptional regulator, anaerobic regulatory protein